ncbi:lasso RiPP family leader peptide-containing protein [Nonomuraea sp. NPDC050404]
MVHNEQQPVSYEPPFVAEVGGFGELTRGWGWDVPDFFDYMDIW